MRLGYEPASEPLGNENHYTIGSYKHDQSIYLIIFVELRGIVAFVQDGADEAVGRHHLQGYLTH